MNITKIDSTTVKTYTVRIRDGEVRDQPHSLTPRRYRVELVIVTKRDGAVGTVELCGSVLKKDGAAGLHRANEKFYGLCDWPEWLRSIVGGLA